MLVVSEVLHFRKNNPQLEPVDIRVKLLIWVRQYSSSFIPAWIFHRHFKVLYSNAGKLLQYA